MLNEKFNRPTLKNPTTKKEIDILLKEHGIFLENYTLGKAGEINVDGWVGVPPQASGRLPVQFGIVTKTFKCVGADLTSLIGCPWMVKESFLASYNELESLEGGPIVVGNEYSVGTATKSLIGGPDKVFGTFEFSNNNLPNLKGLPREVKHILASSLSVDEIDLDDLPKKAQSLWLVLNELPSTEMEKNFGNLIQGSHIVISEEMNYEKTRLRLMLERSLSDKPTIQRKKI